MKCNHIKNLTKNIMQLKFIIYIKYLSFFYQKIYILIYFENFEYFNKIYYILYIFLFKHFVSVLHLKYEKSVPPIHSRKLHEFNSEQTNGIVTSWKFYTVAHIRCMKSDQLFCRVILLPRLLVIRRCVYLYDYVTGVQKFSC